MPLLYDANGKPILSAEETEVMKKGREVHEAIEDTGEIRKGDKITLIFKHDPEPHEADKWAWGMAIDAVPGDVLANAWMTGWSCYEDIGVGHYNIDMLKQTAMKMGKPVVTAAQRPVGVIKDFKISEKDYIEALISLDCESYEISGRIQGALGLVGREDDSDG